MRQNNHQCTFPQAATWTRASRPPSGLSIFPDDLSFLMAYWKQLYGFSFIECEHYSVSSQVTCSAIAKKSKNSNTKRKKTATALLVHQVNPVRVELFFLCIKQLLLFHKISLATRRRKRSDVTEAEECFLSPLLALETRDKVRLVVKIQSFRRNHVHENSF